MTDQKIYQFDAVIYPIKLWVSITNDLTEITDKFLDLDTMGEFNYKTPTKVCAFMQMVLSKEDEFVGALCVFKNKKYCTTKMITHEATHAARRIWEHLNEDPTGEEADAYLVGWIAGCIESVKKGQVEK